GLAHEGREHQVLARPRGVRLTVPGGDALDLDLPPGEIPARLDAQEAPRGHGWIERALRPGDLELREHGRAVGAGRAAVDLDDPGARVVLGHLALEDDRRRRRAGRGGKLRPIEGGEREGDAVRGRAARLPTRAAPARARASS